VLSVSSPADTKEMKCAVPATNAVNATVNTLVATATLLGILHF